MKKRRLLRIISTFTLVVMLVLTLAVPAAAAETVTFGLPTDDAWVKQSSKDANKNFNGDKMDVDCSKSKNYRDSLVMFDISSVPAGATITQAILRVYVTDVASKNSERTIVNGVYRVLAEWDENSVTWNSPGSTAGVHYADSPTDSAIIQGGTQDEGKFKEWIVTDDVSAFVRGTASNYGW
ncbi:MAG: DNRLRE domain-containing protein, partial [Dehalococcoidia bacterium]|nr:DNRLRE domain-containing protein [Dehalococcoidia bacterium]